MSLILTLSITILLQSASLTKEPRDLQRRWSKYTAGQTFPQAGFRVATRWLIHSNIPVLIRVQSG